MERAMVVIKTLGEDRGERQHGMHVFMSLPAEHIKKPPPQTFGMEFFSQSRLPRRDRLSDSRAAAKRSGGVLDRCH